MTRACLPTPASFASRPAPPLATARPQHLSSSSMWGRSTSCRATMPTRPGTSPSTSKRDFKRRGSPSGVVLLVSSSRRRCPGDVLASSFQRHHPGVVLLASCFRRRASGVVVLVSSRRCPVVIPASSSRRRPGVVLPASSSWRRPSIVLPVSSWRRPASSSRRRPSGIVARRRCPGVVV